MKRETLTKVITALPGLVFAFVMLLIRQPSIAFSLLIADLIGVVLGTWWLRQAEGIASYIYAKRNGGNKKW